VREAVRIGLAAPHPQLPGFVQILPVLPYSLRTRAAAHHGLLAALQHAHYQLFAQLGPMINQMLTAPVAEQRRTGTTAARTEYANPTAAASYALAHAHLVLPVLRPVEELLDQAKQQSARRQLLEQAVAAPRPPTAPGDVGATGPMWIFVAGSVTEHASSPYRSCNRTRYFAHRPRPQLTPTIRA
jgi:hypothetical protein